MGGGLAMGGGSAVNTLAPPQTKGVPEKKRKKEAGTVVRPGSRLGVQGGRYWPIAHVGS